MTFEGRKKDASHSALAPRRWKINEEGRRRRLRLGSPHSLSRLSASCARRQHNARKPRASCLMPAHAYTQHRLQQQPLRHAPRHARCRRLALPLQHRKRHHRPRHCLRLICKAKYAPTLFLCAIGAALREMTYLQPLPRTYRGGDNARAAQRLEHGMKAHDLCPLGKIPRSLHLSGTPLPSAMWAGHTSSRITSPRDSHRYAHALAYRT